MPIVGGEHGGGLLRIAHFEDVAGIRQVEALVCERLFQVVNVAHAVAVLLYGSLKIRHGLSG